MVKQPLFGQDSSPHITSMLISAIATLVCWIIFCVMCLVIKFKPAVPEYKEIQIVLSSTPTEQKVAEEQSTVQESASAVLENASAVPENASAVPVNQTAVAEALEAPAVAETVVEQQPAVVEPVETTKPAETKKVVSTSSTTTSSAKTTTTQPKTTTTATPKTTDPSKKVNFDDYQYATDYSDFSFNNTSSNSSKQSFDWSQFDDSSSEPEPAVSQKVDKVTTQSTIQGSAGQTTTQQTQTKTSSQNKAKDTTPAASSSTSDALRSIQNTTGAPASGGTATGSSDVQKFSSDLDITWNGGAARKAKGSLSINLTTGSSIKEKKTTVKIEFIVGEDGYVTPGSVKITPESLLPEEVRKEVISQINLWRFNEGTSRSIATFEYTIIKND